MNDIDFKHLVSLIVWITALFLIFRSYFLYLKKFFALFMTIAYAYGVIYFYIITRSVADTNTIAMKPVAPVMAGLCVLWFILWRSSGDKKL
jgi:hypothetical protein